MLRYFPDSMRRVCRICYFKFLRKNYNTLKSLPTDTPTAVMRSIVRQYEFQINVRNAQDLDTMYAVLTEAYGSQPLGSGTKSAQRYGLLAQEVVRVGEIGEITTYHSKVTAFGFHDTDKSFILSITNTSGRRNPTTRFDARHIPDQSNKREYRRAI